MMELYRFRRGDLVKVVDTGVRANPLDATIAALSSPQRKSFLSLCHFLRNANESTNRSIVYNNGYAIGEDAMATVVFEIVAESIILVYQTLPIHGKTAPAGWCFTIG